MLAVPATAAAPALSAADALERGVLSELNAVRKSHGLGPVRASRPLARAADGHSRAMVRHGFFAHESRDGTPFWKRVARSYPSRGYRKWEVGETLVWSTSLDAREAVRLWLDSAPHRKILLDARWREVGLGAVKAAAAPGAFKGHDVTVVTADFGVRR